MKNQNLTEGGVLQSLLRFAFPVFISLFVQSLYSGVDLMMVGQYAETADISGVSTGSILALTITLVVTGVLVGVAVYVGRTIGQKDTRQTRAAIGTAIVLFVIIGVALSVLLALFSGPITGLLNAPEEAFDQTLAYIGVCGGGTIFVVLYNLISAVFHGLGDSRTPLITVCIACVCNIVGDYIFVAILKLGALGAAVATVTAQLLSVLCSVLIIRKKTLPFEFHLSDIKLNKKIALRELRLGVPVGLQELLAGISFIFIQTIVNSFDVVSSAGVGVAEKVCAFLMLSSSAFSQATSAFVAQNMGANQVKRADDALKCGIAASLSIGIVLALVTFFFGDLLAGIFARDSEVIQKAYLYLKAYAIDTILISVTVCFVGYYNGCGKTAFVMVQGIIGAVFVRIPVVYVISTLPGVTLFHIGLAYPSAAFVQLLLHLGFMLYLKTKRKAAPSAVSVK